MPGLQSQTGAFRLPPSLPRFPPLLGERVAQMAPGVHSSPDLYGPHSRARATSHLAASLTPGELPAPPARSHPLLPEMPLSELRGLRELRMSEALREWQLHCVSHRVG